MNRWLAVLAVLIFLASNCAGQIPLKPAKHGLDIMLRDVPKEQIIEDIRFEDGEDTKINVVRLDYVGPTIYPLLISSKVSVATDSLGLLAIKMHKDTLYRFVDMIDNVTPKMHVRNLDGVLVRITYRFEGRVAQYYLTNERIVTGFLRMIERKLLANDDPPALETFYKFIAPMKLQERVNGKRTWKY